MSALKRRRLSCMNPPLRLHIGYALKHYYIRRDEYTQEHPSVGLREMLRKPGPMASHPQCYLLYANKRIYCNAVREAVVASRSVGQKSLTWRPHCIKPRKCSIP